MDKLSALNRYSIRDLTIIPITAADNLVIACDSIGGIGPKEMDQVQVSGYVVGRFLARVPLMELIAFNATPIAVVDTLSVEWNPTGKDIYRGIEEELETAGLGSLISNGSTEENMTTNQTGAGITIIGRISKNKMKKRILQKGDELVLVGLPKVGAEVKLEDEETVSINTVRELAENSHIKEIIPVGSKGIIHEIKEIINCQPNKLSYSVTNQKGINLEQSGGPATSILIVTSANYITELKKIVKEPVNLIGCLT
ncbi:MAG: AIR synthase related protein [Bacillota bacterium]|nr:AIR synthase related protein [Bacillota bacterium]